jgi:dynactin complex subunit
MTGDSEGFEIGDRVEDLKDGQRGTVRFIGEVPPTKGLWLGVEWDHPEVRGRHDGTHEGVKYFEPTNKAHPHPASFVRPAKVTGGVSVCEAVVGRYGAVEGRTGGVDEAELGRLCKEIGAPFVTVVGFDKVLVDIYLYKRFIFPRCNL